MTRRRAPSAALALAAAALALAAASTPDAHAADNNASLILPALDAAKSPGSSRDIALDAAATAQPSAPCSPDPSECIFRFTDTPVVELPWSAPGNGTRQIEFDHASNRLYVAYDNEVAAYDAGRRGYPMVMNATLPADQDHIVEAMAANPRTGDLYVATSNGHSTSSTTYLHTVGADGDLGRLNVTLPHWIGGYAGQGPVTSRPHKLHVDSERGLVYVSTDQTGIAVANMSANPPALLPFGHSASGSGWRNTFHAWHVSGMAVNSTAPNSTAYAATLYWDNARSRFTFALNTLAFGDGGAFSPNYTAIDRIVLYSTPNAPVPIRTSAIGSAVRAYDMALDDRNDRLFVLYLNRTLGWYDLANRTAGETGLPTYGGRLEPPSAGQSEGIVLDEGRGLLYWLASDSVGVYRTLDGERLAVVDRPGPGGGNAAIEAGRGAKNPGVASVKGSTAGAAAVDSAGSGAVYAVGGSGGEMAVMAPRLESLPERLAREAAAGGTVAIPDGTYRDVYLSTDAGGSERAMTIRPESGQPGGVVFTGASHIRVRNGDVAVQGIVFRDTTCHDKLEDADRADGYLPEHVVNIDVNTTHAGNITVSNNVFENTCHGGILSGGLDGAGSGSASNVVISNNTFKDIGHNARHYDGVPDEPRSAIETGVYRGAVQMQDAEITSNAFERIAGVAVDVRQARNLDVSGNAFADIPLSAIRVHGGSDGVAVRGNTIANASYAPNYDFLRGVEGSADLTQDAAILVIPDDGGLFGRTGGVNATGNTLSKSGGAFSVCGAVCEGNRTAGYASSIGSNADSVLGPADQDIRFNWNTLHVDNGDRLVENGVRGALDARYNYYPGYEPAAGLFRAGAQASGQLPAGTVLYEPLFTLAPGDPAAPSVLRVASANESGSYGAGDQIDIMVEFTKPVAVEGTPVLVIDAGPVDRNLALTRHDASVLIFRYAVVEGDGSPALEYANETSLAAGRGGGGITDLYTGAPANLTLPARGSPESLSSRGMVIGTPDTAAPTVLSVTSEMADGAYRADELVEVQVAFSEAVRVGTRGGTPTILLDTGGAGSPAVYARGSGTDTLVFEYRPASGDVSGDLDYVGTDSLRRNGGTIVDRLRNAANLTLPEPGGPGSLGHSKDIEIDGVAPIVLSVSSPDSDGMYGIGSRINITVTFNDSVNVTGAPALALETGATDRTAAYDPAGSTGQKLAFVYTVQPGDEAVDLEYAGTGALDRNGAMILDDAGNSANLTLPRPGDPGSLGGSKNIAINTTARQGDSAYVRLVYSSDAGGAYGAGSAINITVSFSRDVRVSGALPFLALSTDPPRRAWLVHGTDGGGGGGDLAFLYVVQPGDSADPLDYTNGSALYLNGAAIRDADGNNASLALPDPGSPQSLGSSGIVIGATGGPGPGPGSGTDPPAPVAVTVQTRGGGGGAAPGPYSAGQSIVVGIEFSAPVTVRASADSGAMPYLELRTGSAGAFAAYASGSGTRTLEFEYAVRGGDLTARLLYADASALVLNGSEIAAVGTGAQALITLPEPGAPGSLSGPGSPIVKIDPDPGRPVLDIGIFDDDGAGAAGSSLSSAALAAAEAFNERQGRTDGALLVNATLYNAGAAAESAANALRAAHAGGAGPSVYVGPSTDRGLHAAMPYAAANGIVLVSAGSTAPSLAVEGDAVFRLLPSARLDAEALARHALGGGAESLHAVLENETHGPPTAPAGQTLEDATPPPPGRFSHAFDAALAYAGVPPLSGTVTLAGAPGLYGAAAAAEALDASVRSGRAPAAVVYMGSPLGLAALAEASAGYAALESAAWLATGQSAGSVLLAGGGPAAAFAAESGLAAALWSAPESDAARKVDSLALLPPGADPGARHRAYAAYDAVLVIGAAASDTAAGARGGDAAPDAAAVAGRIPYAAAAYSGALGDIVLDAAGDLWVPAAYDLWTVAGPAAEWSVQPGGLDEERACSIALARAKIDYGPIDSGQTSRPHLQTIVNTGQLPFSRVDLTATPWHVDSPGGCAPGDRPSLHVGLSEIRTEPGGQFSDLAGSGTVLAQGLEAGGQSPLWYRLSLVGYVDLPQAQITQCATYVVRCG